MKSFWPLYLLTFFAGTLGVYVAAPLARPAVSEFFGKPFAAPLQPQPAAAEKPAVPVVAQPQQSERPPAEVAAEVASQPQQAEPPLAAVAPKAAAVAPAISNKEENAGLEGLSLAAYGTTPEWGITHQQAPCYNLDGSHIGVLPGGTLFAYKATHPSSKGEMIECRFFSKTVLPEACLIGKKDVVLFTGSHARLTAQQLTALQTYYALNGKIRLRKNQLLLSSADKNPYFDAYRGAYKNYTSHIDKAKELALQRNRATDLERTRIENELRTLKMGETRIKAEYEAQHKKFNAWKDGHTGEQAQPGNDPDIQNWMKEMAALRPVVPGLDAVEQKRQ